MSKHVWFTATVGNYVPADIKNSFLSFRKYNQEARIVSIVDDTSLDNLKDFFTQYNIEPLLLPKFSNIYEGLNWRHSLYIRWLFKNPHCEHVLLCDARDVVFQDNYFQNLPDKYVYFFQEDSGVTIASEPNNSYWIRVMYGDEVFNQIGNGNILCCGTLAGSRLEFIDLSNYINTEMYRLPKEYGSDQAILNHGYLTGAFNHMPVIKKINGDVIGTLHCTIRCAHSIDKFYLDADQQAIFVNGKKPSIIHQYDRREDLQQYFNNLYPLSS